MLLQPLPIVEWKWDHVTMDFVTGLPRTPQIKDSVWVIVDRLTKSTHFLAMRITDSVLTLGKLYVKEIVRLHRVHSLLFQIEILNLHHSYVSPNKKP